MKEGIYEKVILIGFGRIVGDILSDLIQQKERYGYEIDYLRYEPGMLPLPGRLKEQISIFELPEKKEVTARLLEEKGRALIISAGNNYIFPRAVIEKENFSMINFHNALLPKYRGRNAPTWAIWCGERESGPTWHRVTTGVDEGGILFQKKCPIHADMKAYELARDIMNAAHEGFRELFPALVTGQPLKTRLQDPEEGKTYYSYDVPHGGRFDLEEAPGDIYRLLRAVDYGPVRYLPYMETTLPGGESVKILSYRKIPKEERSCAENTLCLALDGTFSLEMKYGI